MLAQDPVRLEGPAREKAIATILAANDIRTTLQFRFTQTRHSSLLTEDLVSEGRAYFAFPDRVRWETTRPHPAVFVLNAAEATDRRQQVLLRNVAKASEKGLINEDDFTVTVYAAPDQCQVDLEPLRRDLGQLFVRITLLTDARTGALRSIVLSETGGDLTEIQLHAVERGIQIPEELFKKP